MFCVLIIPQNAAKQAAAAATQTIAAAQNAAASNKNTAAHQQLVQSCKVRIGVDSRVPFTVDVFFSCLVCSFFLSVMNQCDRLRDFFFDTPTEPFFDCCLMSV